MGETNFLHLSGADCSPVIVLTIQNNVSLFSMGKNLNYLHQFSIKLEQLERLRSEGTPRRLMITHTIESYWIPSQK